MAESKKERRIRIHKAFEHAKKAEMMGRTFERPNGDVFEVQIYLVRGKKALHATVTREFLDQLNEEFNRLK